MIWVHPPFHSALEGFGSVIALLLAWQLLSLDRRGGGTSFNPQVVAAVTGLGVLDGFHAATYFGDAFVWLRSWSTLVCGAMAVMVWLPRRWFTSAVALPLGVLVATLCFGTASVLGAESLPTMQVDGRLTPIAQTLNLAGGVLLLLAAVRLVLAWRQTHRPDDLLLCMLGALTGGAAITLAESQTWDATWWVSHAFRVGANLGALWFVAFTESRLQAEADTASRAVADLNASLEERVARRTAELEVARDAANAASRAKSEFLANMSHEIRTPLNSVIGLTEVVLETDLDEFQRNHLRVVSESGSALVQVINDILDFSKIEAGKVEIERVAFSPEDLVCETLRPLAVRAQSRGLQLACLVRADVPRLLMGDPARVRQVITNLVGNAITYTEAGQILVRVGRDQDTAKLQISVLDSGIGIAAEKLDRIFESFEQGDSSSTRKYGGTGLGLSISRRLVALMGGEIGAASEPGVGSVFSFTIACEVAPGDEELWRQRAEVVDALRGRRVLIAEENVTERTILATMVCDAEMQALAVASADEALASLRRARDEGDPITAVILSANSSDSNLFALLHQARGAGELAEIPVVLVTSAVPGPSLRNVGDLGVAARLMKPVKSTELAEVLAAAIASGTAPCAREPEAAAEPPDRSLHVLLVEDSFANQKLALALLRTAGHRVTVVDDGPSALARLADERFDLVLMDIQMPGMDGFETTAKIRSGDGVLDPQVPIVAMTAHALRGDREKCLEAGMNDYVAKPIGRDHLLEALRRATA